MRFIHNMDVTASDSITGQKNAQRQKVLQRSVFMLSMRASPSAIPSCTGTATTTNIIVLPNAFHKTGSLNNLIKFSKLFHLASDRSSMYASVNAYASEITMGRIVNIIPRITAGVMNAMPIADSLLL